jgi:hypothetical protein
VTTAVTFWSPLPREPVPQAGNQLRNLLSLLDVVQAEKNQTRAGMESRHSSQLGAKCRHGTSTQGEG